MSKKAIPETEGLNALFSMNWPKYTASQCDCVALLPKSFDSARMDQITKVFCEQCRGFGVFLDEVKRPGDVDIVGEIPSPDIASRLTF